MFHPQVNITYFISSSFFFLQDLYITEKSPLLAIDFVVFKPFIKIIKTYPIFRLSNFFSFTFSSLSNLISSNSSIFYSKLAYYNSSDSCSSLTSSICSRLSITIINLFFLKKNSLVFNITTTK